MNFSVYVVISFNPVCLETFRISMTWRKDTCIGLT